MEKSLKLLGNEFISSCETTPQYSEFHRTFKREFSQLLKPYTNDILIHDKNHFDISGFFKLLDNQIYYFSIGDLRHDKDQMLIRTAEHFKDYSGGSNCFINLDNDFLKNFFNLISVKKMVVS
ncbi:MAG: hypothetical protein CMH64_01625 [Nanoarchaeota archaeon]|jgi:hypothetical protein|nr:hypothetical protein [Nanoarchaeota archaeon]|tara:strand:- start:737 stop:1102 length:366 start_codon:yes stop_codon:yes gene_type:complete